MLNILSVLVTGAFAAAPSIAPYLDKAPLWAHAVLAGLAAAVGAVYHLLQTPPSATATS